MDAYFEMFSGISGNMVLGALIDLGLDPKTLMDELKKLGLDDEYEMKVEKVSRSHIGGTYVDVHLHGHEHDHEEEDHHKHDHDHEHDHEDGHHHEHDHHHEHEHTHEHHGRNLDDINEIIEKSDLSQTIKEKSKTIFLNLA